MITLRRVLVTGAAGGLGRVMCRSLRDAGYDITALARPEDPLASIPLPTTAVTIGYVQDLGTIATAVEGVDAVIHCAALLPNALHLGSRAFQEVNVQGTATLMQQVIKHGVQRIVFFSTISVVDHVTRTITPANLFDFIQDPHDAYLRSKIDAERLLIDKSRYFSGHLAVIRLAFVYGPGNYAVWRQPLELTKQGKMRLLDDGHAQLPLIYAEDIARYVMTMLERPAPSNRYDLHIVANPQSTTMRDVFNVIADHFGVVRPRSLPSLPLHIAATLVERLPLRLRAGRLRLLTRARVMQYSRGYNLSRVLDHPLLKEIEMTDYRVGLDRMLDDYRKAES